MLQGILPLAPAGGASFSFASLSLLVPVAVAGGWLLLACLFLWVIWNTYLLLKRIDYFASIEWTFLEVSVPPDSEETPKVMEFFYEVMGGMHKSPDVVEEYFDGYLEPWISCEVLCSAGQARYFIVVPTASQKHIEGAIYAQYPRAEVTETEDYTQRYHWKDIRKKFDMYGTEIVLSDEDIYPIKTYLEFEETLAEEDRFIDPHQTIIETFTNVGPGEEYWYQVCIRPVDAKLIAAWTKKGEQAIAEISGQAKAKPPGIFEQLKDMALKFPSELLQAASGTPIETSADKDEQTLRFFNPVDEAKMKGILQKVSRTGFLTKIRLVYLAPVGQLQKPNIGRGIGAFKQFNTFHLNGLKPDSATKTNGPNFIMRDRRRYLRERKLFLAYQWREMFYGDGKMFNAEELATLWHLPTKQVKAPGLVRARAGLQSPPENLPYA